MADKTDFTPELTLTPNLDAAAAAEAPQAPEAPALTLDPTGAVDAAAAQKTKDEQAIQLDESKLTEAREGDDRTYLQGGQDIHEGALDLQRRVREVYLVAAAKDASLRVVDCCDANGAMESPERIFDKIRAVLAPILDAR